MSAVPFWYRIGTIFEFVASNATYVDPLRLPKPPLVTLVTRLQAYMTLLAPKWLAKDWPPFIQIDRYSRDNTDSLKKQYATKAYFVFFRAMNQHELLELLLKDKLCAVIKLPSQNLLLTVAGKPDRFMGMVLPVVPSRLQQQQKLMAGTDMTQGSGGNTRSVDRGQVSSPVTTQ